MSERSRKGSPPGGPERWRTPIASRRSRSVTRAVTTFAVAGLLAVGLLSAGAVYAMRNVGNREAVRDAADRTNLLRIGVIEPVLTDAILTSEPAEVARLDEVVRDRIIPAGVVRVKIWDETGQVLYSDEHRLIGQRYHLDSSDLRALRRGGRVAGNSDLSAPENRYEPKGRAIVEVYDQIRTPSGHRLLLENYWPRAEVLASGNDLWKQFAPAALAALLVLGLVQIPLAWRLARRVRAAQADRERFLLQAIESSDQERSRIAADLHDGIVQDLAGVSFTLAAAAEGLDKNTRPEITESLQQASATTRRDIRQLRTLLVDLYPPNLRQAGIEAALGDLLARLGSAGISTSLEVDPEVSISPEQEALVYRTAREATRNALAHARASTVTIRLGRLDDAVVLDICDDGSGFDPAAPRNGHFGLRLLESLARDAGASLDITSATGHGTDARLRIEDTT